MGLIVGQLLSPDGNPMAGAEIFFISKTTQIVTKDSSAYLTTDSEGVYNHEVEPGEYDVYIRYIPDRTPIMRRVHLGSVEVTDASETLNQLLRGDAPEYPVWLGLDFQDQRYSVQNARKDFSDIVSFSRSSGGGRFNAEGQYEWLSADTPRFDHDPVTSESLGILIEEQRTNLIRYSRIDPSSDFWFQGSGVSRAATGAVAPDGTRSTRVMLLGDDAHNLQVQLPTTLTPGDTYWVSVWLRPVQWQSSFQMAYYDGGTSAGAGQFVNPHSDDNVIEEWENGWKRYAVELTIPSDTVSSPVIRFIGWGTGSDGERIDMWGAQLENGKFPTSYIPTTDSQVTRAPDRPFLDQDMSWWNSAEGTLLFDLSLAYGHSSIDLDQPLFRAFNSGSGFTHLRSYFRDNGNFATTQLRDTSGLLINQTEGGDGSEFFSGRAGYSYAADSVTTGFNGTVKTSAIPIVNQPYSYPLTWISLGLIGGVGSGYMTGHIRRLLYFPRAMSASDLESLTS